MAPGEHSLWGDGDELTGDLSQQPLSFSSLTAPLKLRLNTQTVAASVIGGARMQVLRRVPETLLCPVA